MILLDANYILRFLLKDNHRIYEESKNSIVNHQCEILTEVFAEVVFVLQKVYEVEKEEIEKTLVKFLKYDTITINDKLNIIEALKIFETKNLDFVDAILCAKSKKYQIKTFDKKLQKCIETPL